MPMPQGPYGVASGKAGAQGTVWESRVPPASLGHSLVVIIVTSPTAGGHQCDTLT